MADYIIDGGHRLHGSLTVTAGKNAPVALIVGSLLVRGTVVLKDMTHVEEVDRMLEIMESIGVGVSWRNESTLVLDTSGKLSLSSINRKACEVTRASLLLIGALAAREKGYKLYKSGGCKLGNRTIRPHLLALEKFGIHVSSTRSFYDVRTAALRPADVVMYESGDTPTENAVMAAVLARGVTTIKFASSNYMVQDLCYFLERAGAKIQGIGTTTLVIIGVKKLRNVSSYSVMPDPVDAMAWIALAITTKSPITIKNCPLDFLELELEKLRVMGQEVVVRNTHLSKNGKFFIVDLSFPPSSLRALPDKIYGRPFPGLNIDALPLFLPILTQAKGRTLVHDWVYENRAIYYLELQKLGANIILLDPHRVFVEGKSPLRGNEAVCPSALRPAMALLVAMLAAKGRSVLRNVYQIERGYGNVITKLRDIGARITRVETQ